MNQSTTWVGLSFYPTKQQEALMDFYQEGLSRVRSQWLKERKLYQSNYTKQSRDIKEIRKDVMFKHVPAYLMKGTLWSLHKSITATGDPKKVKDKRVNSLEFSSTGWKLLDGKLVSTKLGELRTRGQLPKEADKLTITYEAGRWYVYLRTKNKLREVKLDGIQDDDKAVGVDIGVADWLFLSNGNHFPQHKSLPVLRARLEKHKKSAARKEPNSPRHKEALRRVQKTQKRLEATQRDRAVKIAVWMCERWEVICLEQIMEDGVGIKNHPIYKAACREARFDIITDAILKQAALTGVTVVLTPPWYTSQECGECGWYAPKSLSVREHVCKKCGFKASRDLNAALVLKKRGLQILRGEREANSDWHPTGFRKAYS